LIYRLIINTMGWRVGYIIKKSKCRTILKKVLSSDGGGRGGIFPSLDNVVIVVGMIGWCETRKKRGGGGGAFLSTRFCTHQHRCFVFLTC